ncbi:ribulokinase, partial [Rhizobium ruizarguesonis]
TTPVGDSVGRLTQEAEEALGLTTDCHVAAGMIDAYAGALGALGGYAADPVKREHQLALIAGKSSCIVTFSRERKPSHGMWGTYYE